MPLRANYDAKGNIRFANPPKHGNKHVVVDGITLDSKAEAARYGELKLMLRAGAIRDLKVHEVFPLVVGGLLIAKYEADFVYYDITTRTRIVEDVKGLATEVYKIKRRLMKACHGIDIVEIAA